MNTSALAFPKPQDKAAAQQLRVLPPREASALARRIVFDRDHGVCSECHLDTEVLRAEWKLAREEDDRKYDCNRCDLVSSRKPCEHCGFGILTRSLAEQRKFRAFLRGLNFPRRFCDEYVGGTLWEADHVRGVEEGGGSAGEENLRALCVRCHANVTSEQAAMRAKRRRWR